MTDRRHNHRNASPHWTCAQVRDELGSWALGALAPEESLAVEAHLAGCDACRDEASAYGGVTALLPLGLPPVSPSQAARQALMDRIADEQMAVAAAQAQVTALPPVPPKPDAPSSGARDGRRFHWSQLLVAPLAIALLVMTVWSLELQDQLDDTDSRGDTTSLATTMLPDGFQTFNLKSSCEKCQSAGTLLANPEQAGALMVAWDLDPSQVHEVWCEEGDGSRVLVANLNVSESGEVVQPLVFDQPIAGYSRIYVVNAEGETVEINMREADLLDEPPSPAATERR